VAEPEGSAFNQVTDGDLVLENAPEILGGEIEHGFFGRENDQIIRPLGLEQSPLDVGRREPRGHGLRAKHGQGMRLEGDEDQIGFSLGGNVARGFEDLLMAEMDAVEISDGHDGSLGDF